MLIHRRGGPRGRQRLKQRGVSGLEFALLSTIFFAVFYAILSYAFVMLLYQGLTQAASEGARSAVAVNRIAYSSDASYQIAAKAVATTTAKSALSWLPSDILNYITSSGGITSSIATSTVTVNTAGGNKAMAITTITVTVTYLDYANHPLLPLWSFPGLGSIPTVPPNLTGSATARI